ncbi:MAG: efflux RND transporter periplasmic adaptor subunit [Chloroflexi bacterium]|nr:efflux RND transporter periplasmic adaptor subunit [Chloroflexota bacterium]
MNLNDAKIAKRQRRARAPVVVLAAIAVLGGLWGCTDDARSITADSRDEAVMIGRAIPMVETVVEPIAITGTVVADKVTDITPGVDGIIHQIFVDVGDQVLQGDPLFQTRAVDYEIKVNESGYALELAVAELAQARSEHERIKELHANGLVSGSQFEAAQSQLAIARAKHGIAAARLETARQELADTTVKAPFPGVITRRHIDEGRMMRTMMTSSPVIELTKMDRVEVLVQVPEIYLSRVRPETRATVAFEGVESALETTVQTINDRVEESTRSFEIWLPLENSDYRIKPGQFAKVTLFPPARVALLLDRQAILGAPGAHYVYVEDAGRARRRPVDVQEFDTLHFEVISGLSAGEPALAGVNLYRLSEGRPVAVQDDVDR